VANARQAAQSLSATVTERSELTARLRSGPDDPWADAPGSLTIMTPLECHELLARCGVGRLAYIARHGVPDITPVNYVLDGEDIVIRSGPGPKLQAAERHELVAFEVDEFDEAGRAGCSVVVHGSASRLAEVEERGRSVDVRPAAAGPRRHIIRIRPQRVSGRRLC
jgi:nitroimidazol reductase NimA-like FMN-containing flavoprotein (pyridoxamine 5'-phosphate oxidase superfamily)